jgi:hypothetical protein
MPFGPRKTLLREGGCGTAGCDAGGSGGEFISGSNM